MTEQQALLGLRNREPEALEYFIGRYTPYVGSVVWAILGRSMTVQDAEEVTADVFVALWKNPDKPEAGKVRTWLSAVARNRALNRLRQRKGELPLEEDILCCPGAEPETRLAKKERAEILQKALDDMGEPDREIFVRHYYYGQTGESIGRALDLSAAAVRQRLKRGRDKLRAQFAKGGEFCEYSDF